MFELLTLVLFFWLFVKVIGLTLRMTWGIAKITVSLLIGLALPVLFVSLIFIGGIALLVPIAMIAIAAGIVKACV
jgi:hypothetical protein